MTWQPISTVPSDGYFDVWVEHEHDKSKNHRRANCCWDSHAPWPPEAPRDPKRDRELKDSHGFSIYYPWKATHWAPLPTPPSL